MDKVLPPLAVMICVLCAETEANLLYAMDALELFMQVIIHFYQFLNVLAIVHFLVFILLMFLFLISRAFMIATLF